MAVFRVEKNKGYTVMSNHHLRNKELSLKAKGLLSQMLSLPEDWDYKYLSDYDKKNTFDMEKHLRRRPALVKPDEVFDYYEISESDLQEDTDHE